MHRRRDELQELARDARVPAARLAAWYGELLGMLQRHERSRAGLAGAASGAVGLLEWGRQYLPDHFRQPPSAMHRWLDGQLAAFPRQRGTKLNVLGPRGGAKSTIGTLACPLRAAVEGWEPYIWIVSDTRHQAQLHLENLKAELTDNPLLAADYPHAVGQGPRWRATSIMLRNGVSVEAFGTGQRIRGRRHRAHRPTLIICDDLQNDQQVQSPRQRELARQWFHSALMKAGTARTIVVNLATALHRDALAMVLHRTPGWTSRVFRALLEWPERMDLWDQWQAIYADVDRPDHRTAARQFYLDHRAEMDAGAVLLWPEEEDLYTLMCQRAESGHNAFMREKQNEPVNTDLCEWPESYFDADIWFDQWPEDLRIKTMALDPSKGAGDRRGDYSAYCLLGVGADGLLYIEADLARRPAPQMVADGVALYRRFRPDAFGVEANQFEELLGASFDEEFRRQGVLGARPFKIFNQVSKHVRIRRLSPYLANRRLRFKRRSPSTQLLVRQLNDFPFGDHDDGPDAAEMAIRLAAELLDASQRNDGLGDRLPLG